MVCYSPVKAYRSASKNPATGKRPLTFSGTKALVEGSLYTVPCGGCIGCRIDRAEAWGIRSHHEAHTHRYDLPGEPGSAFLTLTYDPAALPKDNSVDKDVMQRFMKRLRKLCGVTLRYLLCGEYGSRKGRAHYHVVVFGFRFPDRKMWSKSKSGFPLFSSELLSKAWPHGLALLGDVTFQSARYTGAYIVKKMGGERAAEHYTRQSPVDGNWYEVEPEFGLMSLKPGLGERWFDKFKNDVFPSDFVIIDGHPKKPPRYYEKLFGEEAMVPIKRARKARSAAKSADRTPPRLAVREELAHSKAEYFEQTVLE